MNASEFREQEKQGHIRTPVRPASRLALRSPSFNTGSQHQTHVHELQVAQLRKRHN